MLIQAFKRRGRVTFFLTLLVFPLLNLLFLLEQVMIETHVVQINAKIGVMASNLPFAKIEPFAEVLRGSIFDSFLEILRGLKLLNAPVKLS